jgi:hypothetical protein
MKVNGQFHAPAALAQRKGPKITTEQEAGRDSKPVWMLRRNPDSLVIQSVAWLLHVLTELTQQSRLKNNISFLSERGIKM